MVEEVAELRGDGARVAHFLATIRHPGRLADTAGYAPEIPLERKLELLETTDVVARLRIAIEAQRERLADAGLRRRIREDVAEGLDKSQREMLLRRQLAAIRKELGEDGDGGDDDWATRIAEADMPEAARTEAERELGRLERQPDGRRGRDDPDLPGVDALAAVEHALGGAPGRGRGPRGARRRPRGAGARSRSASSSTWPCAVCAASARWTRAAAGSS